MHKAKSQSVIWMLKASPKVLKGHQAKAVKCADRLFIKSLKLLTLGEFVPNKSHSFFFDSLLEYTLASESSVFIISP